MERGSLAFEVTGNGDLVHCAANIERLRHLWLGRTVIDGDRLGDGDPGDFDHGAWHIACHLVAAGGVRRSTNGRLFWLEVSHVGATDEYCATVTAYGARGEETWPVASAEGRCLLEGSTLLGFVEGNSIGRVSARGLNDAPTLFNGWRRQNFDQPTRLDVDGGKVWEHWCTTRDIRATSRIGDLVLSAYVTLAAHLGDLFPAVVARGRCDYSHPVQLAALVHGGLVGRTSALTDLSPTAIPAAAEQMLLEATPGSALRVAEMLDWSTPPRYYMFARRIDRWCSVDLAKGAIDGFHAREPESE